MGWLPRVAISHHLRRGSLVDARCDVRGWSGHRRRGWDRLIAGRGSSAAPDKVPEPRQLKPEPEGLVVGASDASVEGPEPLAAEVDDVVAELERRYKGRRADGEGGQTGPRS